MRPTKIKVAKKLLSSAKWNGAHKPESRGIVTDLPEDTFVKWILEDDNFNNLFTEWEKAKFDPKVKPSLDRIDNTKGYVMGNLEIVTWEDNHRRQVQESRRSVIAYFPDGTTIKFPGVRAAKRSVGYNIQPFLINGTRAKDGILWKYDN